eukprot:236537_1
MTELEIIEHIKLNQRYDDFNYKEENKSNSCLVFNDISLSIKGSKILEGISGCAYGGELYGIIGSSGGGKTSLLSILSGRVGKIQSLSTKCKISGNVRLNDTIIDCSSLQSIAHLQNS